MPGLVGSTCSYLGGVRIEWFHNYLFLSGKVPVPVLYEYYTRTFDLKKNT
jgi:hypothetical protein